MVVQQTGVLKINYHPTSAMKDQEMQIVLPPNPVPGILDPHMEALNSGVLKMNYCDCDGHNGILAKLEKFDEVQRIDRDAEPHKVLIFITGDPRKVTNVLKNRHQKFEYFEKSPSMNNPEMPLVIPPKPFQVVARPPGYGFTEIPLEDLDETIVTDQARSTRHAQKRHRAQQTCQPKCTRMQGGSSKVHKTEPLRPILKTAQSTETKTAKHVPGKKVSFAPELETYWDLSKTVWKGEMPSQRVAK